MKKLLYILAAVWVLGSCKKEEPPGAAPSVEFQSIYPAQVKAYTDKFYIEITYKDGDGNLGTSNPDTSNLYVVDTRIGLKYKFRLRDLSTPNGNPAIEGKVKIEMPPTAVFADNGNAPSESARFDVYLVDNSGQLSNTVTTNAITVTQ